MDRRNFFRKTALVGAGAILIPEIVQSALNESYTGNELMKSGFKKNGVVLFQGDSITDAGRKRDEDLIPNKQSQLGTGYALLTSGELLFKYPEHNLNIYNKGISGNKVYQLQERWEKDCLQLKPDVLSILIGVNDYWHMKNGKYEGDLAKYNADYRDLISYTQLKLPDVRIVICEPFILSGGTAPDETWEVEFDPYRKAAKKIATDFELKFVPFQSVFNKALQKAPAEYWGKDGVHPSLAGAQLMAHAWMKVMA
jgi:lysophospholipase L1-like esterase